MKRFGVPLPCVTVVALMGCATAAQKQFATIQANTTTAAQTVRACSSAAYYSADADLLRARLPFNANDATLQQLTSSDRASADEINTILTVHPKLQACRKAFLDQIDQTTPTLVPIFAKAYADSEDKLIDLIQQRLTWGEYVRAVKNITADAQAQFVAEGQRITARLEQSNQAELEARQRAFAALAAYTQTQQAIDALNRPTISTTQCSGFGNTVNCVGVSR